MNNYEKKNNAKLQDVNDLEAIFGDASFYKEDEEIQESEYDMDKFYKIPLTYGKASIENERNYTPMTVIFWYQAFEIMINEKDLEVALGFTEGLKDFFDPLVEDGEEETENLILKRTRSTPLTKEQVDELTKACPFVKGPQKLKNKTIICVVLDILLDTNSFNNAFLDVLDFAQET